MKKTEQWLAVIRTDEIDEADDRADSGDDRLAPTMLDMGALAWQATKKVLGGEKMLPRDFELTLVPGPSELQ